MISGVYTEIMRLSYTINQCKVANPHNLDIPFMQKALDLLVQYRDLYREG